MKSKQTPPNRSTHHHPASSLPSLPIYPFPFLLSSFKIKTYRIKTWIKIISYHTTYTSIFQTTVRYSSNSLGSIAIPVMLLKLYPPHDIISWHSQSHEHPLFPSKLSLLLIPIKDLLPLQTPFSEPSLLHQPHLKTQAIKYISKNGFPQQSQRVNVRCW